MTFFDPFSGSFLGQKKIIIYTYSIKGFRGTPICFRNTFVLSLLHNQQERRTKMKNLKLKMEKLKDAIEKKILDREEIFGNRTEKWQESEKGEMYNEITDRLHDWYDEVGDWIDEMESFQ